MIYDCRSINGHYGQYFGQICYTLSQNEGGCCYLDLILLYQVEYYILYFGFKYDVTEMINVHVFITNRSKKNLFCSVKIV